MAVVIITLQFFFIALFRFDAILGFQVMQLKRQVEGTLTLTRPEKQCNTTIRLVHDNCDHSGSETPSHLSSHLTTTLQSLRLSLFSNRMVVLACT